MRHPVDPIATTAQQTLDGEDALKTAVIERVLPTLAQGFLLHAQQQGSPPCDCCPPDTHTLLPPLQLIYNATLVLIYRILFLLYAEGRGLLLTPGSNGPLNLTQLLRNLTTANTLSEKSTLYYDRLQDLFHNLNGDEDPGSFYSGALFLTVPLAANVQDDLSSMPAIARFLYNHKISDRFLAAALTDLTHVKDPMTHALLPIAYRNLPVRLLGTIYESLQAFTLQISSEKMVAAKGRRADEIITYQEAITTPRRGRAKREYAPGEVYLVRNRRARRSTGRYYTPACIIQHVLEHTLGPLLHAKFAVLEKHFACDAPNQGTIRNTGIRDEEHVSAFFDIKVLDPAMGSGHFLVAAVNYIAIRMQAFLARFPAHPVLAELASMRATLSQENAACEDSSDLALLKRLVLKRCIFGVDLDPVAVEIAKISLSLDSFIVGAPLPFLDAHLRCGNALIGARPNDLCAQDAPLLQGEILSTALASFIDVSKCSDLTPEQVRGSWEKFAQARTQLAAAKDTLDSHLSRWFGNDSLWSSLSGSPASRDTPRLSGPTSSWQPPMPPRSEHITATRRRYCACSTRRTPTFSPIRRSIPSCS